jgi:hypothetical protein
MSIDVDHAEVQEVIDTARPVCGEEEFTGELEQLVADYAPRLFAVVQVEGERIDGWVAAWGMAFDDGRAHVISVDGGLRMSLGSVDRAARWFGRRAGISARLVWLAPAAPAATT